MSKYYFDIGSSTIKLFRYLNELELIEEKSIMFKKDFSEHCISTDNLNNLINFIKYTKEKYELNNKNTEIYATGVWREVSEQQLVEIKNMFQMLDLCFNVISHEQENDYFEKAMNGNYNKRKIMMINMGGKTTELIFFDKDKVQKKMNLNLGVVDVLNRFPNINEVNCNLKQDEILEYILDLLKDEDIDTNYKIAIHTGGELRFQKLVGYKLKENQFFDDGIHKFYVTYKDFDEKNRELLNKTTLEELYSLMPANPKWMDGAKAGIMLGQAIFKKAKIEYIIPSDLNLIHGVVRDK